MSRHTIVDPAFRTRLRTLRHKNNMSVRGLAHRAYLGKPIISELESGRRQPSVQSAGALDRALNAGGELAAMVTEVEVPSPERNKLWESADLLARVQASDVSAATVEALQATAFELCCAYSWRDAIELRREGLRWLLEVERLLRRSVGLRQHQELLTVAGWLALLVGCVEYDLGMRPAAEATRVAALELATEAGNPEIAAWAWEMSACFVLTQGRYRDVLAAAEAGQTVAGHQLAAVQLMGQEAKARARMGDLREVHKVLDRGRRLLDRFPRPAHLEHHFVVDPDKWDFYAMDAYRLAREDELARHHAEEVLRLDTNADGFARTPMRMAEARLTLGAVAARAGDLEQAVDVALTALRVRRRSLPSLLMVASEVGDELVRRDPGAVTEFREAVRALSAE